MIAFRVPRRGCSLAGSALPVRCCREFAYMMVYCNVCCAPWIMSQMIIPFSWSEITEQYGNAMCVPMPPEFNVFV